MRRTILLSITLTILLSLLALGCGKDKSDTFPEYQYKDTENMVALVRDAAALIDQNGENAFPVFFPTPAPVSGSFK